MIKYKVIWKELDLIKDNKTIKILSPTCPKCSKFVAKNEKCYNCNTELDHRREVH